MTGNPIFVRYGMAHLAQCEDWEWTCTRCKATPGTYGFEWTAGAAADAGREHMRRFHGYSRRCGVSLAACGAQTCRCDKYPTEDVNAAHSAACDFSCCCNGTCNPICATRAALQTTHNQSREDC